jgi:hypothetical protein
VLLVHQEQAEQGKERHNEWIREQYQNNRVGLHIMKAAAAMPQQTTTEKAAQGMPQHWKL